MRIIKLFPFFLGFFWSTIALAQDGDEAVGEAEAAESEAEDYSLDREGERCISTASIRSTDIVDAQTILFNMRGGVYYLNNLSHACPRLFREKRFSYRPTMGRLCNVDAIRVLEGYGSTMREGIACGLGSFYPISKEEAELLTSERSGRDRPQIQVENPNAEEAE